MPTTPPTSTPPTSTPPAAPTLQDLEELHAERDRLTLEAVRAERAQVEAEQYVRALKHRAHRAADVLNRTERSTRLLTYTQHHPGVLQPRGGSPDTAWVTHYVLDYVVAHAGRAALGALRRHRWLAREEAKQR